MSAREIFSSGRKILDAILVSNGFIFEETASGSSSGGDFVSGRYVRGDRSLEIHFRFSLGLVTYRVRELSTDHESYMRAMLGTRGGNRYPGFSDDPLDAFRALLFDLEHFCEDFLSGPGEEFSRCVDAVESEKKNPGFARMTKFES